MSAKLRVIAKPFVVARPSGARVRTRLWVSPDDALVLGAVGSLLGRLTGIDLARRCVEGLLDAKGAASSRRERKRALTADCSSRWAGAITRSTEDVWQLEWRNLLLEKGSLQARIHTISERLAAPCRESRGRIRGYDSPAERFEKQRRLQVLKTNLGRVEARLTEGRVSICRGGRRLARSQHGLGESTLSETAWRDQWEAARWFLTADGEADAPWGNATIRWHPEEGWLEVKLPGALTHLANRPHGRYRLSTPVTFPYRGADVGAQAATGAVRYDIAWCPGRGRWYLDASWKTQPMEVPPLEELRHHPVLAIDLNADHLAAVVLDSSGNPVGPPVTVPLDLAGHPGTTRDGHLRWAISRLLAVAYEAGCRSVIIEDLDFAHARTLGKEHHGRRPSRGRRGRSFRRLLAGIPTANFRDRLVQMAMNRQLWIVGVESIMTLLLSQLPDAEPGGGELRRVVPEG